MKLKDIFNEAFKYKWDSITNNTDIVNDLRESNKNGVSEYMCSSIISDIISIPFYKDSRFKDELDKYPLETLDAIDITINRILIMKSMTVL